MARHGAVEHPSRHAREPPPPLYSFLKTGRENKYDLFTALEVQRCPKEA